MADLTPRTRSESFLNGEDLEPITRREHFYAGRENDLPEGHQEPETREEWFIQKYREAGDVTVESLSITENGTYTAPSGKAYSPVSVDVPLPENAYLLKSIEHESIATFTDGTDNFVKSLKVAIEPIQSGSGEPSPSNIRPIYGHQTEIINRRGANMFSGEMELGSIDDTTGEEVPDNTCLRNKALYTINVRGGVPFYGVVPFDYNGIKYYFYDRFGNFISCSGWQSKGVYTPPNDAVIVRIVLSSDYGTTYNNDISINYPSTITTYQSFSGHAYFISFTDGTNPLTVYGGKLDVVSGELVVDRGMLILNGSEDYYSIQSSSVDNNTVLRVATGQACKQNENQKSNYGTFDNYAWQPLESRANTFVLGSEGNLYLQLPSSIASTAAEFKALFASNPLQVVFELATPLTYQLSPTIIKSLQGENNFFADSGDVIKLQYWGR